MDRPRRTHQALNLSVTKPARNHTGGFFVALGHLPIPPRFTSSLVPTPEGQPSLHHACDAAEDVLQSIERDTGGVLHRDAQGTAFAMNRCGKTSPPQVLGSDHRPVSARRTTIEVNSSPFSVMIRNVESLKLNVPLDSSRASEVSRLLQELFVAVRYRDDLSVPMVNEQTTNRPQLATEVTNIA